MKPFGAFLCSLALLLVILALVAWNHGFDPAAMAGQLQFFLPLLVLFWILSSLGYFLRVYPRERLVWQALIPGLATLALLYWDRALPAILGIDLALVIVALFDVGTLPRRRSLSAERQTGRVASLRQNHRVTLTISNHSRKRIRVWVRDGVPHELQPTPDEFVLELAGRSRSTVHYEARSTRRGAFTMRGIHVRARSRLGLWQRFFELPAESIVHVYPDMKQLSEYALLARTNRLSLMGVRRTRRIGQDNEFERLRDYTPDDNYKHIDWRSTARRRKLTVKDFQANQSQRLIFLIDCGRMMTNQAAGISLLDHALNAMLMLSYVALSRSDSVGLICFSDQIHSFVPPRGGSQQMNRLLHASFDRFPRLVESRYDQAFLHLASQCRKRSLVILISNVIDEVNSHQVERYLASMTGRHLPLGVLLRDRQVFDAADAPPGNELALFRAAAAAEMLTWRHQVLRDLTSKGVLSLDVFPEDLTAPLINRYLEIKARHLL